MALFRKNKNKKEEVVKPIERDVKVEVSQKPKQVSEKSTTNKTTPIKPAGRNIYYVSARKDKQGKKTGWEVKKENASKVTRIVDTKEKKSEAKRS